MSHPRMLLENNKLRAEIARLQSGAQTLAQQLGNITAARNTDAAKLAEITEQQSALAEKIDTLTADKKAADTPRPPDDANDMIAPPPYTAPGVGFFAQNTKTPDDSAQARGSELIKKLVEIGDFTTIAILSSALAAGRTQEAIRILETHEPFFANDAKAEMK